jgi:hypothetical protein
MEFPWLYGRLMPVCSAVFRCPHGTTIAKFAMVVAYPADLFAMSSFHIGIIIAAILSCALFWSAVANWLLE